MTQKGMEGSLLIQFFFSWELPSVHCDSLEHLPSVTHQPHSGFTSDTQLPQSLRSEHSSRETLNIWGYEMISARKHLFVSKIAIHTHKKKQFWLLICPDFYNSAITTHNY